MKRYILTESCFIIDTKNNDCKIYAEEDGMMIEWKDAILNDSSIQYAIIKDKVIKDSDTRKALEVARERLFKRDGVI